MVRDSTKGVSSYKILRVALPLPDFCPIKKAVSYTHLDVYKRQSNEPAFAEISMLSDVAETDWSWTPMLADFDHDGFRDLMITNGFPRDVTDRDFGQFRAESLSLIHI